MKEWRQITKISGDVQMACISTMTTNGVTVYQNSLFVVENQVILNECFVGAGVSCPFLKTIRIPHQKNHSFLFISFSMSSFATKLYRTLNPTVITRGSTFYAKNPSRSIEGM